MRNLFEKLFEPTRDEAYWKEWASEVLSTIYKEFLNRGTKEDLLIKCNYLIYVFKQELVAFGKTSMFTKGMNINGIRQYIFSTKYFTESGSEAYLEAVGRKKISLNSDVIIMPWNMNRLKNALSGIHATNYQNCPTEEDGFYIQQLDLVVVTTGNHHTSVGAFYNTGEVELDVYDISPMFSRTRVDLSGIDFYDSVTKKKIDVTSCHIFGVLYEITRIKFCIENDIEWR